MYLYIFEGGEIAQSHTRPTSVDQKMIDEGTLRVVSVNRGRFLELDCEDTRETPVPIATVEVDGDGEEYHYAPQL